jgi:hypothetical protein
MKIHGTTIKNKIPNSFKDRAKFYEYSGEEYISYSSKGYRPQGGCPLTVV